MFSVQATGTLNIYGGNYVTTAAPSKGSVVYAIGNVNLYGGTLDGTAAQDTTKACATVYLNGADATAVIDGGTILGAQAKSGGSVYLEKGSLTLVSGQISGGTAANYGGNIFAASGTSVILQGGSVTGENVYISEGASVTLEGSAVVDHLYLATNVVLTVNTLLPNAKVALAATKDGAISSQNENLQSYLDAGYLTAAEDSKQLTVKENILYLESK